MHLDNVVSLFPVVTLVQETTELQDSLVLHLAVYNRLQTPCRRDRH